MEKKKKSKKKKFIWIGGSILVVIGGAVISRLIITKGKVKNLGVVTEIGSDFSKGRIPWNGERESISTLYIPKNVDTKFITPEQAQKLSEGAFSAIALAVEETGESIPHGKAYDIPISRKLGLAERLLKGYEIVAGIIRVFSADISGLNSK